MASCFAWFKNHGHIIYKIFIVLVLAGSAAGCIYLGLRPDLLKRGLQEVQHLGIWGQFILVVVYIVIAFPIAVGYTALCLACGFMYGIIRGTLTTVIGIIIGSSVSYWLCGTLCKNYVEKKILQNKKAEALLKGVRRHGFKIILMSRLTPVPFGVQNALFGISGIKFYWYVLATFLGMLPEAFLWCYFGSKIHEITDVLHGEKEFGVWQKVILGSQIAAIVLLVLLLGFIGRRAMKKVMDEQDQQDNEEVKKSLLSDVDDAGMDDPDQTEPTPKVDMV